MSAPLLVELLDARRRPLLEELDAPEPDDVQDGEVYVPAACVVVHVPQLADVGAGKVGALMSVAAAGVVVLALTGHGDVALVAVRVVAGELARLAVTGIGG